MYLPIQEYPDDDMIALVGAASRTLDLPAETILEEFGKFIAPSLVGLYRTLVKPEWKTLDLLENTEQTIHTVVRARNRGARPAKLQVVRTGENSVDLTYHSERRLCAVAKGIVQGVATHYGETVEITETTCMQKGAKACKMEVKVVAEVAKPAKKARSGAPKKRARKVARK